MDALYDLDAERYCLASLLKREEDLVAVLTGTTADDYSDSHLPIFKSIKRLYENGTKPRLAEVTADLEAQGQVIDDRRKAYLGRLISLEVESPQFWVDKLKATTIKRKATPLVEALHKSLESPVKAFRETLQAQVDALHVVCSMGSDFEEYTGSSMAVKALDRISERAQNPVEVRGIPFGWIQIDRDLGGALPGDLIILAAATGQGKTASAQNLTLYATSKGHPGLYIASEMGEEEMSDRFISIEAGVEYVKVRSGFIKDEEMSEITRAAGKIASLPLTMVECPDLSFTNVSNIVSKAVLQGKCEFAIIDYIGRMDTSQNKRDDWQELKLIAQKLKKLAQRLKIAIIMLAQLNDDGSLQGAKQMRNECDMMLELHPIPEDADELKSILKYAPKGFKFPSQCSHYFWKSKVRRGPVGLVPAVFDKAKLRVWCPAGGMR